MQTVRCRVKRALVLVLVLVTCGCGGDRGAADATGSQIVVYAAASLARAFPQIDSTPRYSFAGSDELAGQIRSGAPADVYASASAEYARELHREGLVEAPVTFASNRLVLVVARRNPARIREVGDVVRDGTRIVVAADTVPAGAYTRRALVALGLRSALRNVVSEETDVSGVLAKVALGEADAGFVYATDAAAAEGKVRVLDVPERAQPRIEYALAVVASSGRKAAAEAFVRRVRSAAGRRVLARAGFVVGAR